MDFRYCTDILKSCSAINEQLIQEIEAYYLEDNVDSFPFKLHGYLYYTRQCPEDYLPVFCREREGSGHEEVILDLNSEFSDG